MSISTRTLRGGALLAWACSVLVLSSACAPPPLLDASDAGSRDGSGTMQPAVDGAPSDVSNADGSTSDLSGTMDSASDGSGPTVEFAPVAELIRNKCALSGCHVSSSSNAGNFKVASTDASDQAIADALRDQPLDGESGEVVTPRQPDRSGLYLYIAGERQPAMPLGTEEVSESEIEMVRRWIEAGAPYE